MIPIYKHFSVFFIFGFMLLATPSFAQDKKEDKKENKEEDSEKKMQEIMEKCLEKNGIFRVYQDSIKGTLYLVIRKDQLKKEFIYFSQIENGVLDVGYFKGAYGGSKVFEIEKHFDKLRFIQKNTSYYFDPQSPLAKSSEANISHSVLESISIEAEHNNLYLIKADDIFLSESFNQIKYPTPEGIKNAFSLGSLSKGKSKVDRIDNYPNNLNVLSEFVYSSSMPRGFTSSSVTDRRNVSIKVFQTFIEMPENNYKPRYDDSRVGYFLDYIDDQTTSKTVNYRDMINRWDLQKKNPSASISEPIEPIVWYIENTTPHKFRPTIKKGVLAWNSAFEKIGLKNAIVVKEQSDTATWDAGDIRYNVLRWTSSPIPPFGGYGPSFTNPRTGQILGADIMLEYVHHTNRVFYDILLGETSHEHMNNNPKLCSSGHYLHQNMQLARALMMSPNFDDKELSKMQEEAMIELIMHEVGHTLGLNHNMKSSYAVSLKDLRNADWTYKNALAGSVMDYNDINLHPDPSKQGAYYSTMVGKYDDWAIEFGYKPNLSESDLKEIAEKSSDPALIFGNDADDMRWAGKGIDPRVMIGDLSDDPVQYAYEKILLVQNKMQNLDQDFYEEGSTYMDFRRAFFTLENHYWGALNIMTRQIGGVYVDRSTMGQNGGKTPYIPVSKEDQKEALKLINDYGFAPNSFNVPERLYSKLARQRRGYNFFGRNEDPKIHSWVLSSQKRLLRHLLHRSVLRRMVDANVYGNQYKITEYLKDLNAAIFDADIQKSVNTYRQNLQQAYVKTLINRYEKSSSNTVEKNAIFFALKDIAKKVKNKKGDDLSVAHKQQLSMNVQNIINPKK